MKFRIQSATVVTGFLGAVISVTTLNALAGGERIFYGSTQIISADVRGVNLDAQLDAVKKRIQAKGERYLEKSLENPKDPRVAGSALACPNGVPATPPKLGVVRMNLAWSQDWKAIVDNMYRENVRSVRFSLAPDYDRSFQIVQYASNLGIDVLVAIVLAQPALHPKDAPVRPGGGKGIKNTRGLSSLDVLRYRDVLTKFVDQLDDAAIRIAGIEVGNEINWADFNGDLPILQKGRLFDTLDNPELNKDQILAGMKKYAETIIITKEALKKSFYNKNTPVISAGLFSAWGPWFERSGATALTVGLMNKLYIDLGIDRAIDARAVHIYPQLAQNELDVSVARKKISDDVHINSQQCSPNGQPCLVTEWGFQAEFNECTDNDPRKGLMISFLLATSCENNLRAVYLFDWDDGPRHRIWRCNRITLGHDFFKTYQTK